MKTHRTSRLNLCALTVLILCSLPVAGVRARPTGPEDARRAVEGWLVDNGEPLGMEVGGRVADVAAVANGPGGTTYYVVRLRPRGVVIVPGDDRVEPILSVTDAEDFVPSPEDPLTTLITADLGQRLAEADLAAGAGRLRLQSTADARQRWHDLIDRATSAEGQLRVAARQTVSDVRVAPLLKSHWAQKGVCSQDTYNYYTPDNYPAGCVATAMAQLMYYHRYPTVGIGRRQFTIKVGGSTQFAFTCGGDGQGGPYRWQDIVPEPNCATTAVQREAIGALCYDAGLSVRMSYASRESIADAFAMSGALTGVFHFSNAIKGANQGQEIGGGLTGMINPNLDAGHPVLLALTGNGGHAVVADGYGYDVSPTTRTLYHHLNVGWGRSTDVWYNLPIVLNYNTVAACIYNVYTAGAGEIVSGRVSDASGRPIVGAVVRAEWWATTRQAITNGNGIYAIAKVPSQAAFAVTVAKPGFRFDDRIARTGTSTSWEGSSGNCWGVDFIGRPSSDRDNNNYVDFADFALMAASWRSPAASPASNSGYRPTSPGDLAELSEGWLAGLQPKPK